MVKYLFADSTDFPLQRNFIDLLERYADMSLEAVPTQQQIYDLKENLKTNENRKTTKLTRIDAYEEKIHKSIDDVSSEFTEGGFSGVSDAIKGDVKEEVRLYREAEVKLFDERLEALNSELEKKQASLLHVLGEFLYHDPLDISDVRISSSWNDGSYESSLQVICSSGVSYTFDLDFSKEELKVDDMTKKTIHVPSAMKPTMLSKEKKPRMVEINHWTLTEAEYRSNSETTLETTLVKNLNDEFPRLEMVIKPGEIEVLNFVDDDDKTDILKDEQLKKQIDRDFEEFTKFLLGHFFGLLDEKKQIISAEMNGKNLAEEDLTEDFIMKVAEEYSETVHAIREKGLVENELNLKSEDLERKRTEIYLNIDEFRSKMSAIQQGADICSRLGLD